MLLFQKRQTPWTRTLYLKKKTDNDERKAAQVYIDTNHLISMNNWIHKEDSAETIGEDRHKDVWNVTIYDGSFNSRSHVAWMGWLFRVYNYVREVWQWRKSSKKSNSNGFHEKAINQWTSLRLKKCNLNRYLTFIHMCLL